MNVEMKSFPVFTWAELGIETVEQARAEVERRNQLELQKPVEQRVTWRVKEPERCIFPL